MLKHRTDEISHISRPSDHFPRNAEVMVCGENDDQGRKTPHFHVQIDNGAIELEVKLEHIRNMEIWRTKGDYPKTWEGITDLRDRIIEWLDEMPKRYFGLSNLEILMVTWNDNNWENEIDEQFMK